MKPRTCVGEIALVVLLQALELTPSAPRSPRRALEKWRGHRLRMTRTRLR